MQTDKKQGLEKVFGGEWAKIFIMTVTPQVAQSLLDTRLNSTIKNRPVSDSTVTAYAIDMENGKWDESIIAPIRVAEDGTLMDGQHRLTAVVKSGKTIRMAFQGNLNANALHVIDTGRPRTVGTVLGLLGMKSAHRTAAVARAVHGLETGADNRERLSPDQVLEIIERHRGIRWVMKQRNATSSGPLVNSYVLAAFAILKEKYPTRAEPLWDEFIDGYNLERGNPIAALRNHLAGSPAIQGSGAINIARRTLTALAYRLQGKEMLKCHDNTEGLKFFLPRQAKRQEAQAQAVTP
jgi:hypothetical protein